MYQKHTHTTKNVQIPESVLKILVIGYLAWSLLGTYNYLNVVSNNMAPLLFTNMAMPNADNPLDTSLFIKSYIQYVMSVGGKSPMSYIYNAMPYYKSKNKHLKLYEDEIAGYFQMPSAEELINLNKDNIYTPELPTPVKQEIDATHLSDPSYLLKTFYTGDADLELDTNFMSRWNFKELAERTIRLDDTVKGPQVLVFHTHVKETYREEGENGKGVATVGEELCKVLEEKYGIETLHVTDNFHGENGTVDGAYERMEPVIQNVLRENPSIQLVIDLHRDGVNESTRLVTNINGKPTAKVMFVNGVCLRRDLEGNIVPHKQLSNEYLEDNLALSLQSQMQGLTYYPTLMRKIYLKSYRYSTHMKPNSMIIEVGAQTNTLEEAVNAAEPIADIIAKVLEKD